MNVVFVVLIVRRISNAMIDVTTLPNFFIANNRSHTKRKPTLISCSVRSSITSGVSMMWKCVGITTNS